MEVNVGRTVNELIGAVSMAMDIEEGVKLYHGWRVAIAAAKLTELTGTTRPPARSTVSRSAGLR